MERLREKALISIGRASGFAGFAILCVMIGLSYDPVMMMRAGGALTLLLAATLLLKAGLAQRQDYRRTEMWLLLPRDQRPPKEVAERVSGGVLRETYFRFARFAAGASAGLWAAAAILPFLGA